MLQLTKFLVQNGKHNHQGPQWLCHTHKGISCSWEKCDCCRLQTKCWSKVRRWQVKFSWLIEMHSLEYKPVPRAQPADRTPNLWLTQSLTQTTNPHWQITPHCWFLSHHVAKKQLIYPSEANTTPKSKTPTTFRSISEFALPSMHHNNSSLLQYPIFETSATALCVLIVSSANNSSLTYRTSHW